MRTFPPEILEAILLNLDVSDIVGCRKVNTQFRSLVDDNVRIQLHIECALANVVPSTSSMFTSTQILQAVRKYYTAWQTFEWTNNFHIDDAEQWSFSDPWRNILSSGGVWGQSRHDWEGLRLTTLPSKLRNVSLHQRVLPPSEFMIFAFAIDTVQDLHAVLHMKLAKDDCLLVARIHLLTLSTGKPHPAATGPIDMSFFFADGAPMVTIELAISGNYIGQVMNLRPNNLLAKPRRESLIRIWEWRTRLPKLSLVTIHPKAVDITSFAFLCGRNILVPARRYDGTCELGVVEIRDKYREGSYDKLVRTRFRLPVLAPTVRCTTCYIVPPSSASTVVDSLPADPNIPFVHDNRSRILLVSMSFVEIIENSDLASASEPRRSAYRLFIHAATLESMSQEAFVFEFENTGSCIPASYSWTSWAHHARLMCATKGGTRPVQEGETSHSRVLFSEPIGDADENGQQQYVVVVYDFLSAMALRRDTELPVVGRTRSRTPESEPSTPSDTSSENSILDNTEDLLDPEIIENDWVWKERRVESGLACRKITTDMRFNGESALCLLGEDGIIMLIDEEKPWVCSI